MIAITEGKDRHVIRGFDDGYKELHATEPDVMHLAFICAQWLEARETDAERCQLPAHLEYLDIPAVESIAKKLAALYDWDSPPGTWADAVGNMVQRSSYTP